MEAISNAIYWLANFMWESWMTVLIFGTGLYLSIKFKFYYNFNPKKIAFHFKNTIGKMFAKGEGEGTVSGFAAACTALANTVGTGNISGVASAIVTGGPGAVFWMWVSGLLGMSTKACEIILGQRYRVKFEKSMDEYVCDRSFVMKNAFGWKKGALILACFCFLFGPWTCAVQTEAVTSALNEAFNIAPIISVIFIGVTCFAIMLGGLRRISGVVEKVVPIMALVYVLAGLGIMVMNLDKVPATFALIIKSAFTPMAGVGGFVGATVKDAVRYGVARGIYSNDAGTGYGIIAHAAAKTDHPVRQSSWGWGEVFLDTIIVCSVTAFSIIITDSYIVHGDITSAELTTVAFKMAYGNVGGWIMGFIIAVFAWTTIIGMYYSCAKSVNYAFGDTKANKVANYVYMVYYMLPCLLFYNVQADLLWAFTDILSAMYILITLFFIYSKRKVIFGLFDDFWNRFVPAKERGENPEKVSFETLEK